MILYVMDLPVCEISDTVKSGFVKLSGVLRIGKGSYQDPTVLIDIIDGKAHIDGIQLGSQVIAPWKK